MKTTTLIRKEIEGIAINKMDQDIFFNEPISIEYYQYRTGPDGYKKREISVLVEGISFYRGELISIFTLRDENGIRMGFYRNELTEESLKRILSVLKNKSYHIVNHE